jgi:putative tricarboxylic transport membrane protein
MRLLLQGMAAALLLALSAGAASAQAPFFQGKQIKVLVGFPPGGGSDLYGRVIADGLSRHVEGKPTVIVQNMPGAASVVAMNNYVNRVPRDGTTVLVGTGQLLVRLLLGLDGARAKISDLVALVATPMGRITYASPATGITSAKDVLNPREPLVLGVPEVISTIDAVLGLTVLKVKFKSVTGYPGKSDVRLALLRNEVNLDSQATPIFEQSVRPSVKEGQALPLFAQGFMDGDELVRDQAARDVPSVGEVYRAIHGVEPTGPAWESYKAVARAIGNGGKILMLHSDAPPAARTALKTAIEAMTRDPEYLKVAETVLEGYGFSTGDRLEANIAAIGRMDAASISWLQELLSREFRMKFH